MTNDEKLTKCLAFLTALALESDPEWAYANFEKLGYLAPLETEARISDLFNAARKAQDNYVGIEAKKLLEGLNND